MNNPTEPLRGAPMTDMPVGQRRLAVTVLMQITPTPDHRWMDHKREVIAVIPRQAYQSPARVPGDAAQGNAELIRFDSLEISLHRDEVESYYMNISTDTPRVFVILHENEENGQTEPMLVTVSADLAASYESVDHAIEVVSMDPRFYPDVEAFVLTHHIPEKIVKRKRKDWSAS